MNSTLCDRPASHVSSSSGQSLIEAVVAIAIVVMLITGVLVATTQSLNVSQSGKFRSQAVKYAQEGIELSRNLRDSGWSTFSTYGTVGGTLWCVDGNGTWTADDGDGVCPANVANIFTRAITIAWNDPIMDVSVSVSWEEGAEKRRVDLRTYFTQWR